jgi:Spy/CpxP family protein refolding chaperone
MKCDWRYLVVTLVMGWFLGAASGMSVRHYLHEHRGTHFSRMRERFEKDLKLTPEQKAKVDSILSESRENLDRIFSNSRQQAESIRESTRGRIRKVLQPEQQNVFDKLQAQWKAHEPKWKQRMDERFDRLRDKFHE